MERLLFLLLLLLLILLLFVTVTVTDTGIHNQISLCYYYSISDYHDQAVNELCRICGNLLKPGNWVCKIQDHSELFGTIFLISKDKEGIHPPKCCHKCLCCCS